MARVALFEIAFESGNPTRYEVGASVYVYKRGTDTEATIFDAESGGDELDQPFQTDQGGRIRGQGGETCWVAEGSYDLAIAGRDPLPWEAAKGGSGGGGGSEGESAVAMVFFGEDLDAERPEAEHVIWIGKGGEPAAFEAETDLLVDTDALQAEDIEGLGDAAVRNVGTTAGTVAAGDDPRFEGGEGASVAELEAEEEAREEADAAEKAARETADGLRELLANKDTDAALAANSDTKYPSQKAIKAYVDGLLAASDAVIYKGVIDCSGNPKYPAASAGHLYRVSVAGKIGGGSGTNVEVGDTLLCTTDGAAEGTQAEVGSKWNVIQVNVNGAVVGPSSATAGDIATFSGTSGKIVDDSGKSFSTDNMLGGNSDALISTQKAVKEFVETQAGLLVPKSLVDAKGDLLVGTADNTVARKAVGGTGTVLKAAAGEADGLGWGKILAANLGSLGLGSRHAVEGFVQSHASNVPGAKSIAYLPVKIPHACTLTGVVYEVGGTKNGKVIASLFNNAGERLRKSASVEQSEKEFFQRVAFETTIEVEPGIYWIAITMESATGTYYAGFSWGPWKKETLGTFEAPASFVVPTEVNNTGARAPVVATY